jgi:hypothetical protein
MLAYRYTASGIRWMNRDEEEALCVLSSVETRYQAADVPGAPSLACGRTRESAECAQDRTLLGRHPL